MTSPFFQNTDFAFLLFRSIIFPEFCIKTKISDLSKIRPIHSYQMGVLIRMSYKEINENI